MQDKQLRNEDLEDVVAVNERMGKLTRLVKKSADEFLNHLRQSENRSLDALILAAIMAIIGFLFGGPVGAVAMAGVAIGGLHSAGYFDPKPEVITATPDAAEHAAKKDVSVQMQALDAEFKKVNIPERQNALNIKRYVRAVIQGKPEAVNILENLPAHLQAKIRSLSDYEREQILSTPTRILAQKLSLGEVLGTVTAINVIDIKSSPRNRPRKQMIPSNDIGSRSCC